MTQIKSVNVPRESFRHSRVGFLEKLTSLLHLDGTGDKKRPISKVRNDRMVELSPHLLRDIGFLDGKDPRA